MININKYNCVARDSKNITYKFFIDNNKNLILDRCNADKSCDSFILKTDIIDYSIEIDKSDKLHILYLNSSGELKYSVYPSSEVNDILLCNIELKKYDIKFITLRILNSDIHIFYMFSSRFYCQKCSIYHVRWHLGNWISKKIADVTTQKYILPYIIDTYKKNIYLLYPTDCNRNYCLKKYSADFDLWTDLSDLVIDGASNMSFLISPKGIATMTYNCIVNKVIRVFIMSADINKQTILWSKPVSTSNENVNALSPFIMYKKDSTYVTWEESNSIFYSRKHDEDIQWSKGKLLANKSTDAFYSVYLSNNQEDSDYKSTSIIANIPAQLYPSVNIVSSSYNYVSPASNPINKNTNSNVRYNFQTVDSLPLDYTNQNYSDRYINPSLKYGQEIKNQRNTIVELNSIIEKQKEKISELDIKISSLEKALEQKDKDLENIKNTNVDAINNIKNETSLLLSQLELKLNNVFETLNEKNNLISELNLVIQSFNKIIEEKDEKLNKISKSFWYKFINV